MRDEPAEISSATVASILCEHWALRPADVAYAPVGFGGYHWIASDESGPRWFVTANYLHSHGSWLGPTAEHTRVAIEAAARVTSELADRGYEFVVTALPDRTGQLVQPMLGHWMVQVLPHLQGWTTTDGAWKLPAERTQIAGIVGRLHAATPPEALLTWDSAVPGREALLTALGELERPWSWGPYSEPTRQLLAGGIDGIQAMLAHYDALALDIEASDDPWVVTHGEPHSGNVVRTDDGRMHLIDWDTVKLAPRERDLASLDGMSGDVLSAYQEHAGAVAPRQEAIEMFDLWWALAEIGSYVQRFRASHTDSPDSDKSWNHLTTYVPT